VNLLAKVTVKVTESAKEGVFEFGAEDEFPWWRVELKGSERRVAFESSQQRGVVATVSGTLARLVGGVGSVGVCE